MSGQHGNPKALPGITLAETLIAIGLLGVVMIPVLFASSAFFTQKLVGIREKVGVAHDASIFLNRFMEEMRYVTRLLPESDGNTLYFAYIDPSTQQEIKRGYSLNNALDGSSEKVLKRLSYTGSGWQADNPYSAVDPESIHLPASATFSYCDKSPCSPTVLPEQALFVRLSNFSFKPQDSGYTMTLPTDVDVYLGSNPVLLAESAKGLYSFNGTTFGTGANLNLLSLGGSEQLEYLDTSGGGGGGGGGGSGALTTILSGGVTSPGAYATYASPTDGRVYFAEDLASSRLWTWSSGTLSILVSNMEYPAENMAISPLDGRIFVGEDRWSDNARYLTWHSSTGLSTISSTMRAPGSVFSAAVGDDGRVFFGEFTTISTGFWTWKAGANLSLITTGVSNMGGYHGIAVDANNRVFWGSDIDPSSMYTWSADTLSLITSGKRYMAKRGAVKVHKSTGRAYYAEDYTSGAVWTWSGGTATQIVSGQSEPGGDYAMEVYQGDGRVYFGENNATGTFWSYISGSGLTTILGSGNKPAVSGALGVSQADGRVYFGTQDATPKFYSWKAGSGLTTLSSDSNGAGQNATAVAPDGRVYWGGTGGSFRTWKEGSGVSVIVSGETQPGTLSTVVDSNGTVYFGENNTTGSFWSWSPSGGLVTIIGSANKPGYNRAVAVDGNNTVYFGDSSKFWAYGGGSNSAALKRFSVQGIPSTNSTSITSSSIGDITALAKDVDGYLYMLNPTGKTVERYKYNSGAATYELANTLNWTANATTVAAMAIDNTSSTLAILDSGNKQIDVYNDRTVNGAGVLSSTINLSATTTPTGLAMSDRTGRYLVLDSALQSGTSVRLFVYNSAGTLQQTIPINVTAGNLGVSATTETAFKIAFDSSKNLLYLVSPVVDRVYAVMMPSYL